MSVGFLFRNLLAFHLEIRRTSKETKEEKKKKKRKQEYLISLTQEEVIRSENDA